MSCTHHLSNTLFLLLPINQTVYRDRHAFFPPLVVLVSGYTIYQFLFFSVHYIFIRISRIYFLLRLHLKFLHIDWIDIQFFLFDVHYSIAYIVSCL